MTPASALPPSVAGIQNVDVTATRRAAVDNLYCELLVLADEARAGVADSHVPTDALKRIQTASESLRLTSYLLQMLQWLVELRSKMQSALMDYVRAPARPDWQLAELDGLPEPLQNQIEAAVRLAERADRLFPATAPHESDPVPHAYLGKLQKHFG